MEKTEIYSFKPIDEKESPLVVAGGVLVHDEKFLLLKRHPEKPFQVPDLRKSQAAGTSPPTTTTRPV